MMITCILKILSAMRVLNRIVSFVNTTENPPVERLLIPDMALTAAEYCH